MYEKHFNRVIEFTNTYEKLINCHMVDFITQDLWNKCLPQTLRFEVEQNEPDWVSWKENDNHPVLNNFLILTKSLSLESCSIEINSEDFANAIPIINNWNNCEHKHVRAEFMKSKKLHEVERLGNLIGTIAEKTNNLVIDAGAGKGYLSTFLAESHNVPVLAIDSSKICSNGAICRQKKLQKRSLSSTNAVRYVVEEINESTDYVKILKENFSEWNTDRNLILTGLHACGALTHSALKAFLATDDINILCIVPCCYHLATETFNTEISFSKNARMLAQQSLERCKKNKSMALSLFYRAVLQTVLHSLGVRNAVVGRGAPVGDFASYAQWALTKIGVDKDKIPSGEKLAKIFHSYEHLTKKFHTFQMLRIYAGLVLEAAIMLDRITFLQKTGQCSKLAILRLFDPVLSPRSYCIIAQK